LFLKFAAVMAIALAGVLAAPGPAGAQTEGPEVVTVGNFIQELSAVNLQTGTFLADFYLWFLWEGEIDPTQTFEFTNAIRGELTLVPGSVDQNKSAVAEVLEDGRKYQVYHVQGTFIQPFDLSDYPLDVQSLTISMEDVRYDTSALVYKFDKESKLRADLTVPGWGVKPLVTDVIDHHYPTTFGYPGVSGEGSSFSQARVRVSIGHPSTGLAADTFIPLLIILFISFGSFFIPDPGALDIRFFLTPPALIAAIALHFTARGGLPQGGQARLLDRVFLLGYLTILVVIGIGVYSHRLQETGKPEGAERANRLGLVVVPLFLIAFGLILILR
jgi:hypothetical protein